MKRLTLVLLACCLVMAFTADVRAENAINVESQQVALGAAGVKVNVFVENDVPVAGFVLPLEIRTLSGGAYITGTFSFETIGLDVGGRIGNLFDHFLPPPIGHSDEPWRTPLWDNTILQYYNTPLAPGDPASCSGPTSSTFSAFQAGPNADGVSPDAFMWAALTQTSTNPDGTSAFFMPGSDAAGGVASIVLNMAVNNSEGFFEIDTMCATPANHLSYVDDLTNEVPVNFTKGLITVGNPPQPNNPPVAVCVATGAVVISASPGLCELSTLDAATLDNGSSDPDLDPISFRLNPLPPYPVGVTPVWLVVDDGADADSCLTDVTVTDQENPVITCPADIVQANDLDSCNAVVSWTAPGATDNCGVDSVICDPPSGSTFPIGTTTVTCTAYDPAGNTHACTFDVTVNDDQAPTLGNCPPDTIVSVDTDSCNAFVAFNFTADDNCVGLGISVIGAPPGNRFPVGVTDVKAVAIDDAGNPSDTCRFTVTVVDDQNPVAICPTDVVVNNDPGACDAVVNFAVDGTDNCSGVVVTATPASGSTFPAGTTPVEILAVDAAGNRDSCTFNVTVNDTEPPVVTCPTDIAVPNDLDSCGAVVDFVVSATDNCSSGITISLTHFSGDFFPIGTTTVTAIASDAAGNKDTCTFDVTVRDDQNPVPVCPQDIVIGNDPGACESPVNFPVEFTDNCPGGTVVATPPSGSIFPVGTTPVEILAVDAAGNRDSCTFNVTVNDTELPIPTCIGRPDTTVIIPPGGQQQIVSWLPSVSDNCPGATIACTPPPGTIFPLGTTPVKCIATDAAGNKDSCEFTVTISTELLPPVAICQDVTVSGQVQSKVIPVGCMANADINNGSFDPDGGALALIEQIPPGPYPLGQTLVKLRVTDDEGDMDSCEATVTVVDDTPPSIQCTVDADTMAADENCQHVLGDYGATTIATDDCGGTQVSQNPPPGTLLELGTHTIWLIAADDAANKDSCSLELTVNDQTPPSVICNQAQPFGRVADANCMGDVPDFSTAVELLDNCSAVTLTQNPPPGTLLPVAPQPYPIWMIGTDSTGNSDSCMFEFMVRDETPPTVACHNDTTISTDAGLCETTWDPGLPVATDNCGIDQVWCELLNPPGPKAVGGWVLTPGTWDFMCWATDLAGNRDSCGYTVTVVDDEFPVAECPDDTTVYTCDPAGAIVVLDDPLITDNCGLASVECRFEPAAPVSVDLFPVGTTARICSGTDEAGNVAECTTLVTVIHDPVRFEATPDTLWFVADCAENPDSQCVAVDVNFGSCPPNGIAGYPWITDVSANWLVVDPAQGDVPGEFCVFPQAATLPPGDHEGKVYIMSPAGKVGLAPAPDSVVVMLTVNDIGFDQIAVSTDTLIFDIDFNNFVCEDIQVRDSVQIPCTLKGDVPCWEYFTRTETVCTYLDPWCLPVGLTNEGCGETCWQLFDAPASWLYVSSEGGVTPDEVKVCVDPCNLQEGTYIDTLIFCVCPDPTKDPKVPGCAAVLVKMNITNPPHLMVDPTILTFDMTIGEPNHIAQQVNITNLGGGFINWWETHTSSWLQTEPSSGVTPGAMDVFVDLACISRPDTLRDTIVIQSECALWSPLWVIVDVFINPPPCDEICGIVTTGGAAQPGASVQLWDSWPDGSVIASMATGADGEYCFGDLPVAGPWDIRIVYNGYCTKVIEDVVCGEIDPSLNALVWSTKADVPGGVEGAAGGVIGDDLYVSHGFGATSGDRDSLLIYNIPTDTWSAGVAATFVRSELSGEVACGNYYAIGGRTVPNNNKVERYDPILGLWTEVDSLITGRAGLGTAQWDGLIYAIGGREGGTPGTGPAFDANEVYNPVTDTWSPLAPLPVPVFDNYATVAYDGKIYVMGGWGDLGIIGDVQIYDISTDTWSTGTPVPTPRANAMAGVLCGKIIVFGGYHPDSSANGFGGNLDITEVYDPVMDTWMTGPDMPVHASEIAAGPTQNNRTIFSVGSGVFGAAEVAMQALTCYDITCDLDPIPFTDNPAWPYFADYWSTAATVFNVPLMPGDVILAMDPDGVFCGVTTVQVDGTYLIHVLGDDPTTPEDEGAEAGDDITFLLNCLCPAVAPQPWANQGNFQYDVNFECIRKTIECALCDPWNLLSFNVIPTNPDLGVVLNSIDGKYDRAYSATCDDGSLSWEMGRPINDLNVLNHKRGFGLRVTEPDLTLTIEGFEFPVQLPINLCEGWNLIPYWPDVPDTISHALASIAGLYSQIISLECDGAHTWQSDRPINDLFCLKPCNGYWVKMSQAATLSFPTDGYSCGVVDNGALPKIANIVDRLSVTPYTSDFWSMGDPTITGVVDGDIITVTTHDGTLCGEAVAGAAGAFLVHVYGDDPSTPEVEGAADGEKLSISVNGQPAHVSRGSTVWTDRGSEELQITVYTASALPSEYLLAQNYPNPFNPSTAIRFSLKADSDVKLMVFNVLGQEVQTIHNGYLTAGTHTLIWDGRTGQGVPAQSGVYFYRIETPEWSDVKKMTLLK